MVEKKDIGIQVSIDKEDKNIQCCLDTNLNKKIQFENIENIILPGGFLKGYAYLGFIKYVKEKMNKNKFKNIIGVSIGSVFGLILVLDSELEYISKFLIKHKLNKIDNLNIESVLNFTHYYGISNGIFINTLIKNFLFEQTGNYYITFKELYKLTNKNFVVIGCNLTLNKTEYFSHKTTPDMMVWLAIRISCNIPFLFNSIKMSNNYYLDGGITSNFPIEYIQKHLKENLDKTLILKFNNIKTKKNDTFSFVKFIKELLNSFRHQDFKRLKDYNNNILNLNITIDAYEEHLTDEMINDVINRGYEDTKSFFETQTTLFTNSTKPSEVLSPS